MTKGTFTILALIGLVRPAAQAQGTARLPVGADSRLWIEGTSNLSSWTCRATTVDRGARW